jgi:predicted CoA-binding protein
MTDSQCEFPHSNATPEEIAQILQNTRIIAVVGLSPKPDRPSHQVAQYLKSQGYRIIPVNPGHTEILGEKCYSHLAAVPETIDMVNLFLSSDKIPPVVDQAIAQKAKTVWMQLGIVHNESAQKARAQGLKVVMNKCLKVEHQNWKFNG